MKIGVVGCGAVGSYYGAKLARAGADVHFLLRSDYEVVRRHGVQIRSPQGDFNVRPRCARTPEAIGPCDTVLIALKTTANEHLTALVKPLVGPTTAVVTLQNGLGNEEALAELIPRDQILGGLCFVCLNRMAPGVIHHLDHGLVVLGEFQRWPEPRTQALACQFRDAGVPAKVTDNLCRAHWEKLIWNIPFNGLGVASAAGYTTVLGGKAVPDRRAGLGRCLTTDLLLDGSVWEQLVRELMLEVIAAANAMELGVTESLAATQIERTRTMGPYKPSTVLDFESGRELELKSLFYEPLRQARQAGAITPRLEALCRVLTGLDALRQST